jgi:hypothetical protein
VADKTPTKTISRKSNPRQQETNKTKTMTKCIQDLEKKTSTRKKRAIQTMIPRKPKVNDDWGSTIHSKDPTTTKIYFENINGIQEFSGTESWAEHMEFMKENNIKISGLAETNTNWNHNNIRETLATKTRLKFQNSLINFSRNDYNPNSASAFLPGGCVLTCTRHWTSRIIQCIDDLCSMGRWTGFQYRLKEVKKIMIITAYRGCKQSTSAVNNAVQTAYKQQKLLLPNDRVECNMFIR